MRTVLERGATPGQLHVSECSQRDEHVHVSRRATVEAAERISPEGWNLLHPRFLELADRIRSAHPTLLARSRRISAGYATGKDGVYVLPAGEAASLEADLLLPAVRGRDIESLRFDAPGLRLLLPYRFSEQGTPSLVDIDEFPRAKHYLEEHAQSLRKRHCVRTWGKAWYDVHDPVSLDLTRTPKILVPDVADHNRFAFDPGTVCPLHSAYYIVPEADQDPLYLTGLLNSRPLEFLVQLAAPVVKDGFRRYRRQFLAELPIPEASEAARREIATAARDRDVERLNRRAEALFGLTTADRRRVDEYLEEQRAPHEG